MARPNKKGLDYFPFDVSFFEDEKIEAISGEFGIKGELATVKLLCAVYRNGYFVVWNELMQMKVLKSLPGVSGELLNQIVSRLIKWKFFDENLFNSAGVLTSMAIQSRYFEAIKRRKDASEFDFLLVNVCSNGVNDNINPVNADINTQRKGKEIKEKETKVNKPTEAEISDKIFEMLKRATFGVPDEILKLEAGKIINFKPEIIPRKDVSLINAWAGRISYTPTRTLANSITAKHPELNEW